MRKTSLIIFTFFLINQLVGQGDESSNKNILRLNFINPGLEYEYSISERSKLSANIGFGVLMSYPNLTLIQASHAFFLSSFTDLHYKNIYNLDRREKKSKNNDFNSGDFVGLKLNSRGKNIDAKLVRTDNIDFSIGPTWGLQREFKKTNILFNLGPVYYFDTKGNSGFYPIMIELNIGYNIASSK